MKKKCTVCGKPYKAALFGWVKNCTCRKAIETTASPNEVAAERSNDP